MKVFSITFLCMLSFSLCAQKPDVKRKSAFISGNIMDEKKNPMSVHLDVIDFETKQVVEQSESSSAGLFRIPVAQKNKYTVYMSKSDYLFQSEVVNIPDTTTDYEKKLIDIILQKIEVDRNTILSNLSFDFYQALVIDESKPDLERVISLMNENPLLQIEIAGFTDKMGSASFNREISEQRAKAVVDLLISSGFDNTRMKYKGYGPDHPIASNFTEEGRLQNNRIELKVLKVDFQSKKGKQKKGTFHVAIKQEDNTHVITEEEKQEIYDTTAVADVKMDSTFTPNLDTLARIDYKGKFIADKSPLANSTVNLITNNGMIFQTTKTDKNGDFQFSNLDPDQEVTFGLVPEETKKFKKIFLADTTGTIIKELNKVNGEFVLELLPSEKKKLGTVYLLDPPLKALKTKSKTVLVSGKVIDENGHPIKAQIEILDNATNLTVEKTQCDNEGRYSISLPSEKKYDFTFNKSDYLFQSVSLPISASEGNEKNIEDIILQKVEVGKKIVLNNIFFDSNESTLRKESFLELEHAVKLINDMVSLQIEISGHTDNVGSGKSNRQLSEQRAKAVMDFLISRGCDKTRLKYKGYGSSQPISTNNTDAGRQLNRRTEFKVLKVDLEVEQQAKTKKMVETSTVTNSTDEDKKNTEQKNVEQKKSNNNPIPEPIKKYDKDLNGVISYDEIMIAIDAYFEDGSQTKEDKESNSSIFALLDFFFEQ